MRSRERHDSIKVYTKAGLRLYDALVMGLLAKHVWGCDPARLVEHYRLHITANHADVGVGTGYCLDRCGFAARDSRLVLIDLQPNCLAYAGRRLARYRPQLHVRDALQTIHGIPGPRFDSIALGGVLHCLAGDLPTKSRALDALAPLGKPGAKIFGYSLVHDGVGLRARSRLAHRLLNRLRVVDNAKDSLADLHRALAGRFVACSVEPVGCMALFSAVVPDRTQTRERTFPHERGES